jgi:hypothetical protein
LSELSGLPNLDSSDLGRWAYGTGRKLGDHIHATSVETAIDSMDVVTREDGTTDEAATADRYLKAAGALLTSAALPEKTAFAGLAGVATAIAITGSDAAAPVGAVLGLAAGLLRDALEAVPKALIGLSFLGAAGYQSVAGLMRR